MFNHFCTSGHCVFLEDISLIFIYKTDPYDLLKGQDSWKGTVKAVYHSGLILKKVSSSFITNILSICIFIGLVCFEDKDFRIYSSFFFLIFKDNFICCYFGYYLLLFLLLFLLFIIVFVIIVILSYCHFYIVILSYFHIVMSIFGFYFVFLVLFDLTWLL